MLAGSICTVVAVAWLIAPPLLLDILDVPAASAQAVLGRRLGVLLLTLGGTVIAAGLPQRAGVTAAVGAAGCAALALLGVGELVTGNVGPGILIAVSTEVAVAVTLGGSAIAGRMRRRPARLEE